MKEKWSERNYRIEYECYMNERIDNATEVEKGDLYVCGYGASKIKVFQGKRELNKIPQKLLGEIVQDLKNFNE